MSSFNMFLSVYLEQFNAMTISMTFIVAIICVVLFTLTLYTLRYVLFKTEDLRIGIKVLTILSTLSFLAYISLIIASMVLYQRQMMQAYLYSIGASYMCITLGKQCMYLLFLETLINTFKHSLYEISRTIHNFILSLIILNFVIYLRIIHYWIKTSQTVGYMRMLIMCSLVVEVFYSLFIVGLFCIKLFMLNVARIDQHKSKQYANRVRSATVDIVNDHKNKLKLERSMSVPTTTTTGTTTRRGTEGTDTTLKLSRHKSFTLSQISGSFNDIKLPSFTRNNSSKTGGKTTPSLRQHKSINIHKFNKENKELLDQHQLLLIDSAAKHTVLCCVAFVTSLQLTLLIGVVHNVPWDEMNKHFILSFIAVLNALGSDLCVLLRYPDAKLSKIYGALCCSCSICCTHCFLYCSLRRVMTRIEDKLSAKIQEECDLELAQTDTKSEINLKPKTLEKLQSISVNSSQLSVSSAPTANTCRQGNKTPSYCYDMDDENANERVSELPQLPRMNITVTSPDNMNTVCTFNANTANDTNHTIVSVIEQNVEHGYGKENDDAHSDTDSEDMDKDIVFV